MTAVVTHRPGTMRLARVPEPADPRAGAGTGPPGGGRDLRVGPPLPDRRDRDAVRVRSPVPARSGSRGGRPGRGAGTRLSTRTTDRPAGRIVPHVVVRRVLRVHPRPAPGQFRTTAVS
jgi:hypothetical protein